MSRPKDAPVWSWHFESRSNLRRGLEGYTAFQDGTLLRRYGHEGFRIEVDANGNPLLDANGEPIMVMDPTAAPNPELFAMVEMSAAQRRAEIDQCMDVIEQRSPHWWKLLDCYYRKGASCEPRGWLKASERMGYRTQPCPALVRCPATAGDNRFDFKTCDRADEHECVEDRVTFVNQLNVATGKLYNVHLRRTGRR